MKKLSTAILALSFLALSAGGCRMPEAEAASYSSAGLPSTLSTYLQRCQAFAGLSANSAFLWEDFMVGQTATTPPPGWQASATGTGAYAAVVASTGGGVSRLTSAATANSTETIFNSGGQLPQISTGRGCFAYRFRITTTPDAQTTAAVGALNAAAAKTVAVGAFGASSTANFVIQYDAFLATTFLSTGVALNTNFHIVEIYFRADDKVRVIFDGRPELSASMAAEATDAYAMYMTARNGTTAAAQTLDIDWALVVAPRS